MLVLLISIVSIVGFIAIFGFALSGPRYKGRVSDHFNGRHFINPGNVRAKGFPDVLKWMVSRKTGPWREITDQVDFPKPDQRIESGIHITFINHSTFLIQVDGLNILTDPVFSRRTSPFQWVGPKRMRPPGIRLADLPPIDVVLLSHNHWDHLDIIALKQIQRIHHPKFITPLGVGMFLHRKGIPDTKDLDWWQASDLSPKLRVESVPAQHFSGRGTFDRDATLWCGYVIYRTEGNIYFAGDTGYNENTFKEIGQRCAPIRVALLPIGAFKPKWFMSPIHCSPDEAVKIHLDVRSKTSVATHFGTFALADDAQGEPVEELQKALASIALPPESFLVLKEGIPASF